MRNTSIKHLFPVVVAFLSVGLLLFYGCGSVIDRDFEPATGTNYHPFESTSDHGSYLAGNGFDFNECTGCHGADLHGINNGVISSSGEKDRSCYGCHSATNHRSGMTNALAEHGDYLREHNWDMNSCNVCHTITGTSTGLNFGGNCTSCHHNSLDGPTSCNTCHGYFNGDPNDPLNWAPPSSIMGDTAHTNPAIGAHSVHLTAPSGNTRALSCDECHVVPVKWDSPGHINDDTPGKAEVRFKFPGTKGVGNPVYNSDTQTCSSTACHGGNDAVWTDTGTFSACNSCHNMPPTGRVHYQWPTRNDCYKCHELVIDENGTIIAPQRHVDGYLQRN